MITTNEEYNRRLSICYQCPHIQNSKVPICNLCGCMLKMKARLEDFNCPINKWSNSGDNRLVTLFPLPSCNSCGKKV